MILSLAASGDAFSQGIRYLQFNLFAMDLQSQNLRLFVAGATGFTGRHLVKLACASEIHTTAHIRPDSTRSEQWIALFKQAGARVDQSIFSLKALETTLSKLQPTHVFCLIGTTQRRRLRALLKGTKAGSYEQVDYGLTKLLLDATRASAPDARFVWISATGASPHAFNRYLRIRAKTEKAISESGLNYTIVRPSFITGPDRDESRPLEQVGAWLVDRCLKLFACLGLDHLVKRFSSMHASELARILLERCSNAEPPHHLMKSHELYELSHVRYLETKAILNKRTAEDSKPV
ncbi:MAG: NAD(P)H-binding protein [Myxococcales bacterium]|nr:MAG: NAD(P)H-binding protein [Myxococcales bacterium]